MVGRVAIGHSLATLSRRKAQVSSDDNSSANDEMSDGTTRADVLIRYAHQFASSLFKRNFDGFALTAPQHDAMMVLAQKGPLSQAALGRELRYDRATVGGLVRRLLARGLVKRASANPVGSRHVIALSEGGAALLQRSEAVLRRTMKQFVSPLDLTEQRLLVDLLTKLASQSQGGIRSGALTHESGAGLGSEEAMVASPAQVAPAADLGCGETAMPLEQRVTFRFSRLAALSTKPVARLFQRRYGLTVPSWRALITIGSLEPTSPTEIARRMSIEADRVTRTVDHLVAKGLVRRKSDMTDGRRSVLALTRRGQEVYAEIDSIRRTVEGEMLSVLSEREFVAFQGYMNRIDAHGRRIFLDERYWEVLFAASKSSRKLP